MNSDKKTKGGFAAAFFLSALCLSSCASGGGARPDWVDKSESAYNKNIYLSAVGNAMTRSQAEAAAFGNLAGFFGQKIKSEMTAVENYKELLSGKKRALEVSDDIRHEINISAGVNRLVAAEIGARWEDRANDTWYAVAVMDKARALGIYNNLIDANVSLIDKAVSRAASEEKSLDAVIRYQFAAQLADANGVFSDIVIALGGGRRKDLKSGMEYRADSAEYAKKIPIKINIKNDKNGAVAAAFSAVFSAAGFRTTKESARYVLDGELSLTPVEFKNELKHTRFRLEAKLRDEENASVVLPFHEEGREGQLSQTEADARAVRAAEKSVRENFADAFSEYLNSALPKTDG